jgi:hypothetical protein
MTFTILARWAKLRADRVSPMQSSAGLTVATMNVLELPPMESWGVGVGGGTEVRRCEAQVGVSTHSTGSHINPLTSHQHGAPGIAEHLRSQSLLYQPDPAPPQAPPPLCYIPIARPPSLTFNRNVSLESR